MTIAIPTPVACEAVAAASSSNSVKAVTPPYRLA
jgi:hypothetical protein